MKKTILTIILCSLSAFSHAEWRTYEECTKHLSEDEKVEVLEKENSKFYLRPDHRGSGLSIYALNIKEGSLVTIRKTNDKYDIKLSMSRPLFSTRGTLYLVFLDKEGFELGAIKISNISERYSGNLYQSYVGDWDDFKDIYSFEIDLRGNND